MVGAMDHKLILRALLDRGMKQEHLAKELGVSQATVSRWLKTQVPDHEKMIAIFDIGREHGVIGDDHSATMPPVVAGTRNGDVPNLTIRSGAGNGGLLHIEVDQRGRIADPSHTDGFWSFPDAVKSSWRRMGNAYAIPVLGDSMEPTLANGSYVFVDTGHTVPNPADIYAIDYGDGLVIKRVELVPMTDKIRIISDNRNYREYELLREEVRVYGRVVAWFQWRG